jgi:hypothetical protein
MRLFIPLHDHKKFTYHPDTKTFVSEASTLGSPLMSRVWDDACDIGFEIQGREAKVLFVLSKIEESDEREIISWHYVSELVGLGNFKAVVFND